MGLDGIIKMMNNESGFIGPVNLGNPAERTVTNLAEMVIKFIETKSNIVYKDLPQDDPKQRKPDISLAKKVLNWEPKISTEAGIQKTIEYFKNRKF